MGKYTEIFLSEEYYFTKGKKIKFENCSYCYLEKNYGKFGYYYLKGD